MTFKTSKIIQNPQTLTWRHYTPGIIYYKWGVEELLKATGRIHPVWFGEPARARLRGFTGTFQNP